MKLVNEVDGGLLTNDANDENLSGKDAEDEELLGEE